MRSFFLAFITQLPTALPPQAAEANEAEVWRQSLQLRSKSAAVLLRLCFNRRFDRLSPGNSMVISLLACESLIIQTTAGPYSMLHISTACSSLSQGHIAALSGDREASLRDPCREESPPFTYVDDAWPLRLPIAHERGDPQAGFPPIFPPCELTGKIVNAIVACYCKVPATAIETLSA